VSRKRVASFRQKESLGEYGSGWGWDWNYAHVFDDMDYDGLPLRLPYSCANDFEETNGKMLYSSSIYIRQISCTPNAKNAGNHYLQNGATVNTDSINNHRLNSICPKGWMLTVNAAVDTKSWHFLIKNTHDNNAASLSKQPLSFIYAGLYNGEKVASRNSLGNFLSNEYDGMVRALNFNAGAFGTQGHGDGLNYYSPIYGWSVRCVAR